MLWENRKALGMVDLAFDLLKDQLEATGLHNHTRMLHTCCARFKRPASFPVDNWPMHIAALQCDLAEGQKADVRLLSRSADGAVYGSRDV